MTSKSIQRRIEQISDEKWDEDGLITYYDILEDINNIRSIDNFNLCINIGDDSNNYKSNISIIIFDDLGPESRFKENKKILTLLGDEGIISKTFIDENTLVINFDF